MYNKNLIRQPSGQINLMSRQEVYWWWFSRQVVSDSCDPKDRSLPDSSFHGILQARILEWVAISCSKRYTRVTVFKKYAKFQGKSILKAIDKPQNINNKRSFEILLRSLHALLDFPRKSIRVLVRLLASGWSPSRQRSFQLSWHHPLWNCHEPSVLYSVRFTVNSTKSINNRFLHSQNTPGTWYLLHSLDWQSLY